MYLKKSFPYIVAGYVIIVGVFLSISYLIEGAFFDPKPPMSHLLIVFSIIFIGAGTYFIYRLKRGELKKAGKSITEVRQKAIEKQKDKALLAKTALEDESPRIRKTAERRLEELNN